MPTFASAIFLSGLPSYRVKLPLVSGSAFVSGKAGALTVTRFKAGETSGTAIAPTASELLASGVSGLYELRLAAADLDTPGAFALHVAAAGAEPTVVFGIVLPRTSVFTA